MSKLTEIFIYVFLTPKLGVFPLHCADRKLPKRYFNSKEQLSYQFFSPFPKREARGHLQKCVFSYMQIGSLHAILYFTCAPGQDYILLIHPGFGRLLTRRRYTEHAPGRWGWGGPNCWFPTRNKPQQWEGGNDL